MAGQKRLSVIGIGAGDPEHLTLQAARRLAEIDAFFLLDKGSGKQDLAKLREDILDRHAARGYRVVRATDPGRDRDPADYRATVHEWHERRADLYEAFLRDELADGGHGAILVWGDPALYDSTIAILDAVKRRDAVAFDYEVLPGVSSVSVLAAQHRTAFNRIGTAVQITTGRRLAEGFPEGVDDVLVLLDAHCAFQRFTGEDLEIFWGAYLGTPDEMLVAGPLAEVSGQIVAARAEARERKGWIMDVYLLRRRR
ncbi:precorrin-6A synthase (deacetylating) [Amycolatopsis minnesotensis]|uniref:Precorrin-6A synthase (Deacetylating) n=1 Tax=Amycolatopsis minnesotensis TaxID=337894 RepID=A0ABN2SV40_9PSEU